MRRYVRFWAGMFLLSWQHVRGLTVLILGIFTMSVLGIAVVALALRAVIDACIRGDATTAVIAAIVTAFAYGLQAVLKDLNGNVTALASEKVGQGPVQAGIHRDIATLESLDHLERTDYLDRVTVVRGAGTTLVFGLWNAVGAIFNLLQLCVVLLLLGHVSPWLLWLLAFAMAPLWFDERGQRGIVRAETDTAETFRLQRHLFELVTRPISAKEIIVAGTGPEIEKLQATQWRAAMAGRLRARVRAALWRIGGWAVFTVGFVGGLALVIDQESSAPGLAGSLVLTISVAVSLRDSLHDAISRVAETALTGRLIEPVLWLRAYAAADRVRITGRRRPPSVLRDGITLDEVSYRYPGSDKYALREVSVHLPAGAVVAVVGEYGSGKTTLVKLLHKFYRPSSGTVRVDGEDINDLDTTAWRARSSAAYQDFGRFHTVVSEAVGLGDLANIDDRPTIEAAITTANAESLVRGLPDGLDTQLGRPFGGVDLSEGQWQKIALARAAMRVNSLLFVLDEPTASLDAPSEQEVFERYMVHARALAARQRAVTVIVSHRFSTVASADLILVLHRSRLIEAGTHEELLAAGGRYADQYNLQTTAYQ